MKVPPLMFCIPDYDGSDNYYVGNNRVSSAHTFVSDETEYPGLKTLHQCGACPFQAYSYEAMEEHVYIHHNAGAPWRSHG